ncbi:FCD domain-containing protein [uncultured Pseudacidovorax sp.]|uniref:HTH gntR-type domain-containing protein n=2 Tax=Pseudacidovorax intermedius TaxID=433924 RepID=A0A147GRH4_9BURK|nr:FCD domain-containing protein [uncultured Pseudacidovorax sp.]KTT18923.1 hypothetical protein NS331_15030 [Pseudacidovorax intermedius]
MVIHANSDAIAFQPMKLVPGYRALSSAIEQRIVRGELQAGMLLPTELELAQQLGVNRSTVREAIRQLEQEGFLVRQGGRRLYVRLPGAEDVGARTARALMLQQVTFHELWQVAMVLEPQAAELAAAAIDAPGLTALRTLAAQLEQCHDEGGTAQRHAELDVAFHAQVAAASRNRVLMMAREPINLLYRPTLVRLQRVLPQTQSRNVQAHTRLIEAIAAGDGRGAAEWMRKHLVDFQRGYALAGIPMDTALEPDHLPA